MGLQCGNAGESLLGIAVVRQIVAVALPSFKRGREGVTDARRAAGSRRGQSGLAPIVRTVSQGLFSSDPFAPFRENES